MMMPCRVGIAVWATVVAVSSIVLRPASGVEITVLVQNVNFIPFVGGGRRNMNERADQYGALLVGLGDAMPDVIGLTETFVQEPTDRLVAILNTTYPHRLRFFPETPLLVGKGIDSGLTLLSRFPVLAHDYRMFDRGNGPDVLAAKGVLVALLRLPASLLVISVTHQNAGGTHATFRSQLATNRATMRDFVATHVPADALNYTAVISMGDYNIASDSDTYDDLLSTLAFHTVDPHLTLNPGTDGFTFPAGRPRRRIDYVFQLRVVDEHGRCAFPSAHVTEYAVDALVVADSSLLSDHRGVRATVSIGEQHPNGAWSHPNSNDFTSCDSTYLSTNDGVPTSSPGVVQAVLNIIFPALYHVLSVADSAQHYVLPLLPWSSSKSHGQP